MVGRRWKVQYNGVSFSWRWNTEQLNLPRRLWEEEHVGGRVEDQEFGFRQVKSVTAVLVSYSSITNYPKLSGWKTVNIFYLTVSMSQRIGCRLVGCLWRKVSWGCSQAIAGAVVSFESSGKVDYCFPVHSQGVWQPCFLRHRPLHGLPMTSRQLAFPRVKDPRES